MAEDKAKNRGKPKVTPSGKNLKIEEKKEVYENYKGEYPLHNAKHELFAINLLTMKQGEAYIQAGYNQTGDNAMKSASKLLSSNHEVLKRYEYLKQRHNEEMERKGFISREQMIANAVYAMNCSLGKLPVKKFVKYADYTETVEVYEHDIKAFPNIWDKLMNSLDYYPKDKEKGNKDKLDDFLDLLGSAINGAK